jgi:hypothetical protein
MCGGAPLFRIVFSRLSGPAQGRAEYHFARSITASISWQRFPWWSVEPEGKTFVLIAIK